MATSRRELNRINSRKRILKASRKLFLAKGYDNARLEDIAEKAEVSKATLYNYFPNKESLIVGTVEELVERLRGIANKGGETAGNHKSDNGDKGGGSVTMIRRILEELILASAEYRDLARRITYLNSCEDSPLYDTQRDVYHLFCDLVSGAKDEGTFRADSDTAEIADTIMGIYLISQFQWNQTDEYTQEEIHEKLNGYFDNIMSGYYG